MTWPANKAVRPDDKRVQRGHARRLAYKNAALVLRMNGQAFAMKDEARQKDYLLAWNRIIGRLEKRAEKKP